MILNGVDLYVEQHGPRDAPALLFVHGHGAGSYHFLHYQASRLSTDVRLIALDQRGVLRSAPIGPDDRLDLSVLLEDYEALREHLGIERWTILGQSAGGNYAAAYATRYPESVEAVVFDCPAWDMDLADRQRLPIFAELYEQSGEIELAAECRRVAGLTRRITAADKTYELAFGLGDRFQQTFWYDPSQAAAFVTAGEAAGFPPEYWERGLSHGVLFAELYDSKIPLLAEICQPTLLIRGAADTAAPDTAVAAYLATARDPRVEIFERSGHFVFVEDPERYADVVRDFVTLAR
ncbi:alpha/beta fold hydrolase [Kribbella sp. CA-253562]|uniref:alpha/beta fold hydrolase n=1 Tax=Kribbella sp. CA-253562 TaxID=3239942 RepID=UPI003D8DE776